MSIAFRLARLARRLGRDTSGLAFMEFAFALPPVLLMALTGAELTNYATTRMRISQLALHVADNAARIGEGSQLSEKKISETQINDLFTGAMLQSGDLDLNGRGRIVLSDLRADPAHSGKFMIGWQRCKGTKVAAYAPQYGTYNQTSGSDMTGMGPSGRQVTSTSDGATMFVEVYYEYQPLVSASLVPTLQIKEVASMMVRDRRALTGGTGNNYGIYNTEGATASTC